MDETKESFSRTLLRLVDLGTESCAGAFRNLIYLRSLENVQGSKKGLLVINEDSFVAHEAIMVHLRLHSHDLALELTIGFQVSGSNSFVLASKVWTTEM
jgi:hypothetical protein